jgi:hypothetical protein
MRISRGGKQNVMTITTFFLKDLVKSSGAYTLYGFIP